MPLVKSDPVLSRCGVRYGGRLGFLWLFPEEMGDIADADPHVLAFMSLPAPSRLGCGIYCRADADAKAEARMESAFASAAKQLRQSGVGPERSVLYAYRGLHEGIEHLRSGLRSAREVALPRGQSRLPSVSRRAP